MIVLDQQIWPSDFFDVVCPGGFIPEFWVLDEQQSRPSQLRKQFAIVGFAAGLKAEQMSCMSEASIVNKTLAQLDDIFGGSFS